MANLVGDTEEQRYLDRIRAVAWNLSYGHIQDDWQQCSKQTEVTRIIERGKKLVCSLFFRKIGAIFEPLVR